MSKLSLFDKIGIMFETTASSNLHILAVLILIVLGLALSTTTKKNEKRNKIVYISYTIFILVFVTVSYHSSLGNMFSYMMNNFFIAVYFPNLAIYLAAIIVTNIILFISIFNYKTSTEIKNLNVVVYTIMNYLLLLVLTVINRANLDIFSTQSVYENKEATALIELSSLIFIIWIIFLIVYKVILIYLKKEYRPKVKKVIVRKKVKKLPENFVPLEAPYYIYGNIPHRERIVIKNQENPLLKEFESRFTLEEYKLFSKILKEHKMKTSPELAEIKAEVKQALSTIDIVGDEEKDIKEEFRRKQKEEIMKMEDERRRLLELAEQKRLEEENKPVFEQEKVEVEEEIKKEEQYPYQEKITFDYEPDEKEQAKLTELEMLYRSIK